MQHFNQKRVFSSKFGYKCLLFLAVHIPINRRQYWLYSQHCLYFPFPVYLEIEGKSENFFCCLNKCLITVYVFQLVRNKKTISLLELKRLTLKNPNPGSQQPLIKQGLDLVHLTLPVVLAAHTPIPQRFALSFEKHQTAVVAGQVSAPVLGKVRDALCILKSVLLLRFHTV